MANPSDVVAKAVDEGASKRQKTEAPAPDKAVGRFKALGHVVMAMRRFQGAFCVCVRGRRCASSRELEYLLSLTQRWLPPTLHTLVARSPVPLSLAQRADAATHHTHTASLNPTYQYGKRATDSGDEVCCCSWAGWPELGARVAVGQLQPGGNDGGSIGAASRPGGSASPRPLAAAAARRRSLARAAQLQTRRATPPINPDTRTNPKNKHPNKQTKK